MMHRPSRMLVPHGVGGHRGAANAHRRRRLFAKEDRTSRPIGGPNTAAQLGQILVRVEHFGLDRDRAASGVADIVQRHPSPAESVGFTHLRPCHPEARQNLSTHSKKTPSPLLPMRTRSRALRRSEAPSRAASWPPHDVSSRADRVASAGAEAPARWRDPRSSMRFAFADRALGAPVAMEVVAERPALHMQRTARRPFRNWRSRRARTSFAIDPSSIQGKRSSSRPAKGSTRCGIR